MRNPIKGLIRIPPGAIQCWHVDEYQKNEALKKNRPFCELFSTSEYFYILRQDNDILEGYLGRDDDPYCYFKERPNYLVYFKKYNERQKIYFTLDRISLYEVIEIVPGDPIKLILKRRNNIKDVKANQVFMIMPFHNHILNEFYSLHIKPFLKEQLGVDIKRVDDFQDNHVIIEKIRSLIEESEMIICDTTIENKNVFYELGYASALGKEIITIQNKNTEKLFFDRAHIQTLFYEMDNLSAFKQSLETTIRSIRNRL